MYYKYIRFEETFEKYSNKSQNLFQYFLLYAIHCVVILLLYTQVCNTSNTHTHTHIVLFSEYNTVSKKVNSHCYYSSTKMWGVTIFTS